MTLVVVIHHQGEWKWAVQCVLIADATTSHYGGDTFIEVRVQARRVKLRPLA